MQRVLAPLLTGAGIGIAGVDHQRADLHAGIEMLLADLHRGGAEAVLGEYAGDGIAFVQADDQHVVALGFLDAGGGDAQRQAGNGEKSIIAQGFQVYCHLSLQINQYYSHRL